MVWRNKTWVLAGYFVLLCLFVGCGKGKPGDQEQDQTDQDNLRDSKQLGSDGNNKNPRAVHRKNRLNKPKEYSGRGSSDEQGKSTLNSTTTGNNSSGSKRYKAKICMPIGDADAIQSQCQRFNNDMGRCTNSEAICKWTPASCEILPLPITTVCIQHNNQGSKCRSVKVGSKRVCDYNRGSRSCNLDLKRGYTTQYHKTLCTLPACNAKYNNGNGQSDLCERVDGKCERNSRSDVATICANDNNCGTGPTKDLCSLQ
ncbi:MAG: hypothetical protein AAF320_02955 [Myxococcota bacterium]